MSTNTGTHRRTKIIATWGPSLDDEAVLRRVIRAGVDVLRLNFSHATHAQMERVIPLARRIAQEEGRTVALLQDIQGPRIRTGSLAGGGPVELTAGQAVTIVPHEAPGGPDTISVVYPHLVEDLAVGQRILIADGTIALRVTSVPTLRTGRSRDGAIQAVVEQGGALGEHKGVNLPDSRLSAEALTDKDKADLAFGVRHNLDYVALSFVRRREDVLACRQHIHSLGGTAPIIAKIEHPDAIANLEEVLAASDGVLVARGDLGVEVSPERVPLIQKQVILRANELGLPVITATQMLESMVERPVPTRAEASDVANAVLDGTDALMLSAETAVGRYPVETVETMGRIALEAEQAPRPAFTSPSSDQAHQMALAARDLAKRLSARAIIVFTRSGRSAQVMSHQRPARPIYSFTDDPGVCRLAALWYGVTPIITALGDDFTAMVESGIAELRSRGLVEPGDRVVALGASPWAPGAPTNVVTVRSVPAEKAR